MYDPLDDKSNFPLEIEYVDTNERVVISSPEEIELRRTLKVIQIRILDGTIGHTGVPFPSRRKK